MEVYITVLASAAASVVINYRYFSKMKSVSQQFSHFSPQWELLFLGIIKDSQNHHDGSEELLEKLVLLNNDNVETGAKKIKVDLLLCLVNQKTWDFN